MTFPDYECEKCGWKGDVPDIAYAHYEDGGYHSCPNGCKDKNGEPEAVIININSKLGLRTLKTIYGGR